MELKYLELKVTVKQPIKLFFETLSRINDRVLFGNFCLVDKSLELEVSSAVSLREYGFVNLKYCFFQIFNLLLYNGIYHRVRHR